MIERLSALEGRVQVWFATCRGALAIPGSEACLSTDELHREQTWKEDRDRLAFRAGRVLARHALTGLGGRDMDPGRWTITCDRNGRPVTQENAGLSFSISHAGDCVAVVASASHDVGIDIEPTSSAAKIGVVWDVLTGEEILWLRRQNTSGQPEQFVRLWTMKEACAKALSLDVDDWSDIEAHNPLCLRLGGRSMRARTWQTTFSDAGASYEMSLVALDRQNRPTRCSRARQNETGPWSNA